MSCAVDVLVVGGGPAGAATAIWASSSGLKVKLLERSSFPRHRPGETLHPGLVAILRQLGVEQRVETASMARHRGQRIAWGDRTAVEEFGSDMHGPWQGYQIPRERLDAILLDRAREAGAEMAQPEAAKTPIIESGRVIGARARHPTFARFVVDAGGGRGWLRHHLHLSIETASPPLHATYGYCEGEPDDEYTLPSLSGDRNGWTWIARIAPRQFHWTRLTFDPASRRLAPPAPLASLRRVGRVRGANVTWRQVSMSAGSGYFLVGDAAFVVDPASSHGILRALMSGMMTAHVIKRIMSGVVDERTAAASYCCWTRDRFHEDVRQLSTSYRKLQQPPGWLP